MADWLAARRPGGWLRDVDEVGPGAEVRGRPDIRNEGRFSIGARFRCSSLPVVSHFITGPKGEMQIGDDVSIDHGAAVHCSGSVRIGNNTRIGAFMVLADSDFHVIGDRQAEPPSRPVIVGRDVRIGPSVTILRGSRIGDGAHVLAGSTVVGVVPPGAIVSGVPARDNREGSSEARSIAERVPVVVARVLGIGTPAALEDRRAQLAGWDAVGALRVLLAIEDEFGIRLDERDMRRVRDLAELVALVEARSTPGASGAT